MINLLGLALYGPLAASTRYRLGIYVEGLSKLGIQLEIKHLLGDDYLQSTYSGRKMPWLSMLRAGCNRFGDLVGQGRYDVAMIHFELFPLIPGWAERALMRRPYIHDFDDALYLKYRNGRFRVLSSVLGRKCDSLVRGASAVTAGNQVLLDYALEHNERSSLLPTVVDTDRYAPAPHRRSRELVVGWIGSPSTAPYLSSLVRPLAALGREGPVRLRVVGGAAPKVPGITVEECEWSETTEIELINSFDIGVMPLPDTDWARGKCAFKLIQYMACGIPVVASPVGANADVVSASSGYLAESDEQWLNAFRALRDQPELGKVMGEAGRARVEARYSLRTNLPVLADVIHGAAGGRR